MKKNFRVSAESIDLLSDFTEEQAGVLIQGLINYYFGREEKEMQKGTMLSAYNQIKASMNKQIKISEARSLGGKKSKRSKTKSKESPIKDILIIKKDKTPKDILIEIEGKEYKYPTIKQPMESEDGIVFTLQGNIIPRDNITIVKDLDGEYYSVFGSQTAKYIGIR